MCNGKNLMIQTKINPSVLLQEGLSDPTKKSVESR